MGSCIVAGDLTGNIVSETSLKKQREKGKTRSKSNDSKHVLVKCCGGFEVIKRKGAW